VGFTFAFQNERLIWIIAGISLGFLVLSVALLATVMVLYKRRMHEFFKKNGGSVLQKVENIKIFTKKQLKKITNNNSHVLGKGGFGEVYKGTLEDNTMVAVKSSILVNESRKEDFTNEVIIQSQMIHKNIIKLLGCCLEVDVPMLVYEFAANGNLQDVLHGDANHQVPLSLDLRLDIAIESSEGLKYMHSSTNRTIRHGDVKPANILLDENFMPKISDFGTSKLLTVDKDFTMFVVGSMGYIDPVFHKTGHLTQKSDVYSFGVVLLELVCRKPTIYNGNCSLIIDYQKVYEQENSGRAMFDKDIAVAEEDVLVLEEIGRLAIECLKEKVEDRPDMKEVAERLVMLRRARKHGRWSLKSPCHFEEINTDVALQSFATDISATSSATPSVPSTPV
jgi:serine/threonine protein kinase